MRAHPDVVAALAARGITDLDLVLVDIWTYGHSLIPERVRPTAGSAGATSGCARPRAATRTPTRSAGSSSSSTSTRWSCSRSRTRPERSGPPAMGEYDPALVPGPASRAPTATAARDHPARRRLVRRSTARADLAELAHAASGSPTARAWCCTPWPSTTPHRPRPVAHRMSFAEMVVPYRDPIARPRPAHRVRHRRVGPGVHDHVAGAGLRLPRRDPLPRRRAARHRGRAVGDPQRDLPARGGRRRAVEARRRARGRAGAPAAPAGRVVATSPSRTTSTSSTGGSTRTAAIECEVRATGIMVTTPFAGDGRRRTARSSTPRTYAPIHQHFIVARLDMEVDGAGQHRGDGRDRAAADRPGQPARARAHPGRTVPLRTEAKGVQDVELGHPARRGRSPTPGGATRTARPVAYKLVPAGRDPGDARPVVAGVPPGPGASATRCGSRRSTPTSAGRAASSSTRAARTTGLPVWTAADRSIEDTDVVLWYVFGIHHVPRVEDWPVMPVDVVSFRLKPSGFFDGNPALDVAPERAASEPSMARYGPQFGPDITFLGRGALRLGRPVDIRGRRRRHPRRALRRRHVAPAGHAVRAAAHPPDLLPAPRRLAALARAARRRAGHRPEGARRGRRRDVLRRRRALGARPAGRGAHRRGGPARSRWCSAATTRSPGRTPRAWPSTSGRAASR